MTDARRRARLLAAHAQLFGEILTADPPDRLAKLANVLGGLASANDAEVLRPPGVQTDSVGGSIRLNGRTYGVVARWSAADAARTLADARRRPEGASIARTLLFVVEGVPDDVHLDPDDDADSVLIDGRDLALLLEGRWSLEQAVHFKQVEQRETGDFAQLPLAPPADEPAADSPARMVASGPDTIDRVLTSNIDDFTQTAADREAQAAAEERRLRRWRWGLIGVAIAAIAIVIIVIQSVQATQRAALADAEQAGIAALQFQDTALRNLDSGGAERFFAVGPARFLRQTIDDLRSQGVFVVGTRTYDRLDSRLEDGVATVVLRESGGAELRRLSDGALLATRDVATWVLQLHETDSGRWLVQDLAVLDPRS